MFFTKNKTKSVTPIDINEKNVNLINHINLTEGYVLTIVNDYFNIQDYPLYVFFLDGDSNLNLIKSFNYSKVKFDFLPPSISSLTFNGNSILIDDFSDNKLYVEAKKFQLFQLGQIKFKNPLQILIDLGFISL